MEPSPFVMARHIWNTKLTSWLCGNLLLGGGGGGGGGAWGQSNVKQGGDTCGFSVVVIADVGGSTVVVEVTVVVVVVVLITGMGVVVVVASFVSGAGKTFSLVGGVTVLIMSGIFTGTGITGISPCSSIWDSLGMIPPISSLATSDAASYLAGLGSGSAFHWIEKKTENKTTPTNWRMMKARVANFRSRGLSWNENINLFQFWSFILLLLNYVFCKKN